MTAVKPTADIQTFVEQMDMLVDDFVKYEAGRANMPFLTLRAVLIEALNVYDEVRPSLASHRQPESALDGARNARSVEVERIVERLKRIHNEVFPRIGPGPNYEHDEYFDELTRGIGRDVLDAIELLRAYAKLLRGEK